MKCLGAHFLTLYIYTLNELEDPLHVDGIPKKSLMYVWHRTNILPQYNHITLNPLK